MKSAYKNLFSIITISLLFSACLPFGNRRDNHMELLMGHWKFKGLYDSQGNAVEGKRYTCIFRKDFIRRFHENGEYRGIWILGADPEYNMSDSILSFQLTSQAPSAIKGKITLDPERYKVLVLENRELKLQELHTDEGLIICYRRKSGHHHTHH